MTQAVRWGVLGTAKFARDHMARAIHAAEGAELAALASRSEGRAADFQAFCPSLTVHDDYDALLADPSIDAVYVPLPNHLHVEWTLKALDAGKHVLTEKPLALSADEFGPVIKKRDSSGLLAAEAFMIVHHPQWQRARDLYADGAIGRLLHVDGFFSYDNSADPENIRNRSETGGGSMPDIGVYTMGSARFVTGEEPQEVWAEIDWENGVDVTAHVRARFPSFRFQASTSMRMHPRQEMTFHGSDGILKLTTPFNAGVFGEARLEVSVNARSGPPCTTTERWPAVNQYVRQVEAFCRSVRDGAAYPWALEDARGTQRMIDMAFAATS